MSVPHRRSRALGEDGYAIVAAVASIAVFATMSLMVMTMARASIESGSAAIGHARASAAADAGVALALSGLISSDRASRWSLDGRSREIRFGNAIIAIRIEDEQGKVPINRLDDELVENMVAEVGLTGERARIASDSYLDWIDDDDDPRANGAELDYYAKRGLVPRNSALRSVGEIADIRGFDKQTAQRLMPIATVNIGNNPFRADFASAGAIRIMLGANSPLAIERERAARGQVTAIELDDKTTRIGRPVTIIVDARLDDGARAQRRAIVELTGATHRPYVVLAYE